MELCFSHILLRMMTIPFAFLKNVDGTDATEEALLAMMVDPKILSSHYPLVLNVISRFTILMLVQEMRHQIKTILQ